MYTPQLALGATNSARLTQIALGLGSAHCLHCLNTMLSAEQTLFGTWDT